MPALSRWLLRVSFFALVIGGALGAWLLASEPWPSAWVVRLRAAHIHLMLFGWLMPFVLGTAYWMLPKHAEGPARGSAGLGAAAGGLVTGGVVLGVVGALAGWEWLQRVGTLGVIGGGAVFISLLWPRIKAFGAGRVS
ncbi:MAG TPA: cbb3-type cytochrome c oxidase subunit I [Gemmatimonadales bacterium]|nr:cbb3-type cytochrome c oxidase subunit I [Gemmatimonadales bacterium]